MAMTADESLVACGQYDGRISLVDSETGDVRFETVPLASKVRGLGFSNKQCELIVGYASGAIVSVNLVDQSVKTRLNLGQPIQKLIVSADGSKIAVVPDETSKLRVFAWPQARELFEINYRGTLAHMAFTTNGQRIVVSGGPFLDVFDASSGKRLGGDADLGTGYVHFQVFRDDSRMVVAEGSKGITIRELPSCRVLKRMLGSAAGIQCVAVSADGRNFASDGREHVLRIWDAQTSDTLLMLTDEAETGFSEELHFSRDGQKLFGFEGMILNVWESRCGELMPLSSAPAASTRPTRP
jgi:WD40 repeat protein